MTATVPIAKVARLNPPTPRELFDHPEREVSFVPMARLGEDGRLHNGEARPVGELAQGYTYFANGDVIVAKITPCLQNGKAAYVENLKGGHGFGSTEFHVIRPSHVLDGRYLFYMIWNPTFRHFGEQRFTGSAGQKRMPASAVAEFEIPLPYPNDPKRSLAEQKRIAAILDKADAIRRRRHEAARLTDQLIPSLFCDMFGDPGRNPQRWPETTLGELMLDGPQNGLYRPSSDYGSGTRIVRIDSFYSGALRDIPNLKRVRIDDATLKKFRLAPDEVLINRVNSTDFLGKCALVPHHDEPMVFESNMMRMQLDTHRISPRFLVSMLQTQHIRAQILKQERAAVNQSSINQDDVRSFKFPLPPIGLQRRYAERVPHILELRDFHATQAARADDLFNSLVQRAFRGEL